MKLSLRDSKVTLDSQLVLAQVSFPKEGSPTGDPVGTVFEK